MGNGPCRPKNRAAARGNRSFSGGIPHTPIDRDLGRPALDAERPLNSWTPTGSARQQSGSAPVMRTSADLVEGSAASVGISRIPSWALDRERADPAQSQPAPLRLAALGTDGASPIPIAPLMRVSEAAAVLRVSTKTIRRLIAKGDLQVVRVGRSVRLRQEEINCYISKPSSNSKY